MKEEKVSPSDLRLLQLAEEQAKAAQVAARFAEAHLTREYKLNQGDRIDDQGVIVRVDIQQQNQEPV